jgi:hypothetical protein
MRVSDGALNLLGALVLEDGRAWAEAAHDFQVSDAAAILDASSATLMHYLTRSRGCAKTSDLAGCVIADALEQAPAGASLFGLAADVDQGRLLLAAIAGFRERTPGLADVVDVQASRAVFPRGVSFTILAADAPSSWGLTPWFVVCDELGYWPETPGARALWDSVSSAVAKLADARLVVLTTPSAPSHWSFSLLEHGRADAAWRVSERRGPSPWITAGKLEEQRRRLTAPQFQRLFLGEWCESEDALLGEDDLAACCVLDSWPLAPEPGRRYLAAVDLGLRRDRTVGAVAHVDGDGGVVLDRMMVWTPRPGAEVQVAEVERWLLEACRAYNRAPLLADPWQMLAAAQRLRVAGVDVREHVFSAQSTSRIALALLNAVRERRLRLPAGDDELLGELRAVRLVERSPGQYRLDHASGGHDDRAVVLAMLCFGLASGPVGVGATGCYVCGQQDVGDGHVCANGGPVRRAGDLVLVGERYRDLSPAEAAARSLGGLA